MGVGGNEQVERRYHREVVLRGTMQPELRILEGDRHVQLHAGTSLRNSARASCKQPETREGDLTCRLIFDLIVGVGCVSRRTPFEDLSAYIVALLLEANRTCPVVENADATQDKT